MSDLLLAIMVGGFALAVIAAFLGDLWDALADRWRYK